jgi:hypothetical protein
MRKNMKKLMFALMLLLATINVTYGAVIETDEFTFTNKVTFTNKALGTDATDTNGLVTLQQLGYTYWITNTTAITNTQDFSITLNANKVTLHDVRMYLSLTNGSPLTKRATVQIYRNSNRRCTDMVYLDTNQLYYSILTTVAGVAGESSNVVADASGSVVNDLYWKDATAGTNDYQRVASSTATAIIWSCTNLNNTPVGTLISHVNQFGGFPYYDANGSSTMWFRVIFNGGYTGVLQTAINYGK